MRTNTIVAALSLLLASGVARADKKFAVTRERVEADLRVEVSLVSPAKARPGDPVQVAASLKNVSTERSHKVVEPGNGCSFGIVEPYISYAATFTPVAGKPKTLKGPTFSGMCGMGDYRWHNRVRDLAPGERFDIGARLSYASAAMNMSRPGRYDVRVHYAFRRRGTTEKLPQADPVGELGPMERSPPFEIVSDPVTVHVARPIEVFVEPRGSVKKGVARRLSDLVTARFENWRTSPLEVDATSLRVEVEVRGGKVRRKAVSTKKTLFGTIKFEPGEGFALVGEGGIYDEAWAPSADGPLDVAVVVRGYEPNAPPVRSHWVRLEGPASK